MFRSIDVQPTFMINDMKIKELYKDAYEELLLKISYKLNNISREPDRTNLLHIEKMVKL